jgi:hypothetical protein
MATEPTPPEAPFTIEIIDAYGSGCPDLEDIEVDLTPTGYYYMRAQFNEYNDHFFAETDDKNTTSRINCTIDYKLHLAANYRLDYAEFYVDGEYHLAESGTAFLSIRHNVPGVDQPVFHQMSRSIRNQDPFSGNFQLFGSIDGIDERVNYCGASIPLQVQLRATARRAADDTFVAIDNGDGTIGERRGVREIDCYGRVISCE